MPPPHGEHGATQGPHGTPVQDTEAIVRPSHLVLPHCTQALWPRVHLLGPGANTSVILEVGICRYFQVDTYTIPTVVFVGIAKIIPT